MRNHLILTLLVLVTSLLLFFLLTRPRVEVEPYWIAVLPLCILPMALAIRRFPAALLPMLIFMSDFKAQAAASNFDFRDPTFWTLCLLLATMLIYALLALSGIHEPSLSDLILSHREAISTYLLFVGVVAFSYLYSLAPEFGFTELTRFLVIGSVLYFSPLLLVRSESDIRHFTMSTLAFSLVVTVQRFVGVTHYSGTALRGDGGVEDLTKIGTAELIGMGLLLLLLVPKSLRVRLPRHLLLLFVPWLVVGLTISIARGPILSFVFVVLLSSLTSKAEIGLLTRKVIVVGLVLVVLPIFLVSLKWVQETAPDKVEGKKTELVRVLELSDPGGSAGQRLEFYKQAIEGFAERPILGWGIGSFSVYATGRDTREYPHNLVLQVGMEQGVVGLAALAAFSIAVVRALKKINSASRGEWAFFVWVALYLLCVSMFSGDLDDQRPMLLWCGMSFASWRILKRRLPEQRHFVNPFARVARPLRDVS
jgi:O-antigen ligase